MPDASTPATTPCPRCGAPIPATTGGVCLRCLGERALRSHLPGEPPPDSIDTSSRLSPDDGEPGSASSLPAEAPRQLGAYEIIEEIGRGGMGVVYAARHRQLARIVALKVITAGGHASAEQEMRFVREAQTAARLRHPHIVAIHDAGHADGFAYYTMDLVADGDLAQRLRARPLPIRAAATLLHKVADAVAHAHRAGVLHRDLKPSNILLEDDEPRVSDFGLAAQHEPGADLTAVTRLFGTPAYLAPEVLRSGSKAASPASDVYALGAILYETLTGRPPFVGEVAPSAIPREPVAPRLLAPGVPRDLETIALKCLEHVAAARYANAGELAADLQRFLDGRPITARPVSGPAKFARWCRRRPALAMVWFLVVAIAIGAGLAAIAFERARAQAVSDRARALAAEAEAETQLRAARLAQAEALRLTRRAGRRAEALTALAAAAKIRPGRDVRDAAIAVLALHDIELVRRWPIQAPAPLDTMFAPDGSGYAVTIEGGVAWRETGTDREFGRMLVSDAQTIGWQAMSRDGTQFASRFTDNVVRVWERNGEGVRLWRTITDRPHPWPRPRHVYGRDLEFSPDGRHLALAHREGGFSIVDLATGAETLRFSAEYPSTRIQYSPDGHWIAQTCALLAAGKKALVLDATTLAVRHTLDLGGNAFDLGWSADGAYLAASTDKPEVRVFRATTGALVATLPAAEGNVARVVFGGSDQLLLTGSTEQVFRWRWRRSGEELLRVEGVEMSRIWPTADGREFFTSDHLGAGLHFRVVAPTGLHARPVDGDSYALSIAGGGSLSFSPDGRWLAATAMAEVALFRTEDLTRMALVPTVPEGDEAVTTSFTRDGAALFVCGLRSGLRRFPLAADDANATTLGAPETLLAEEGWQLRDMSADGSQLALLDQQAGRVKILAWDGAKVSPVAAWSVPGAYSAAFGPDARTVLINVDHTALVSPANPTPGTSDTKLRLWNADDGRELATLDAPISAEADWDEASGVALTTNGEHLTVLWQVGADGRWTRAAPLAEGVPQGNTTSVAIAPGGNVLAFAAAGGVVLVERANGAPVPVARLRDEVPISFTVDCVFSPDGERLALIDAEGTLRVWHLPTLRAELGKLGLDWAASGEVPSSK